MQYPDYDAVLTASKDYPTRSCVRNSAGVQMLTTPARMLDNGGVATTKIAVYIKFLLPLRECFQCDHSLCDLDRVSLFRLLPQLLIHFKLFLIMNVCLCACVYLVNTTPYFHRRPYHFPRRRIRCRTFHTSTASLHPLRTYTCVV